MSLSVSVKKLVKDLTVSAIKSRTPAIFISSIMKICPLTTRKEITYTKVVCLVLPQ